MEDEQRSEIGNILIDIVGVIASEIEHELSVEIERPKRLSQRKWKSRRSECGASVKLFEELNKEDPIEYPIPSQSIESDGEIEYLEEDAEIVHQCVQQSQETASTFKPNPSLLIERPRPKPVERRKRKKDDEDSDYDPSEEIVVTKKKQPPQKKTKTYQMPQNFQSQKKNSDQWSSREQYVNRKKLNIRIPDYDDPLCLPVRAVRSHEVDLKRLHNWNNVCLEHFKYCDEILKPERGETKKSIRTAVFKNVVNKLTGTVETTIWSKTSVETHEGDKKSEIFQCVLPRYKEKKVLNNYILGHRRAHNTVHSGEVILSKENIKDAESLVVYKPKESMSAIYGLIDKRKKDEEVDRVGDIKMYLKELACCKLCAACYQGSWRGAKKNANKTLVCPICARTSVSVYNLLTHLKTHSAADVKRYRKIISKTLAEMVGYHYKCRVCRHKFDSIKALRRHTPKHQSAEIFKCEVGNHLVNVSK